MRKSVLSVQANEKEIQQMMAAEVDLYRAKKVEPELSQDREKDM